MKAQAKRSILSMYLGSGSGVNLRKYGSKLRTSEPRPTFTVSYKNLYCQRVRENSKRSDCYVNFAVYASSRQCPPCWRSWTAKSCLCELLRCFDMYNPLYSPTGFVTTPSFLSDNREFFLAARVLSNVFFVTYIFHSGDAFTLRYIIVNLSANFEKWREYFLIFFINTSINWVLGSEIQSRS